MKVFHYSILLLLLSIAWAFSAVIENQSVSTLENLGDPVSLETIIPSTAFSTTRRTADGIFPQQPPKCSKVILTPVNSSRRKFFHNVNL